jgi:hypothetical protein
MKIGIDHHGKVLAAGTLVGMAMLITGYSILSKGTSTSIPVLSGPQTCEQKQVAQNRTRKDATSDPTLHFQQLEVAENELYQGNGRNIFRFSEIPHSRRISISPKPSPPAPVIEPVVQPIALRFFGFASMVNQRRKAFLGRGDAIFVANEGEIVDRRYRVLKIDSSSVLVEDLIEKSVHTLMLPG